MIIESFEKASFWRLFKAISERFDSYLMVFQTSLYHQGLCLGLNYAKKSALSIHDSAISEGANAL